MNLSQLKDTNVDQVLVGKSQADMDWSKFNPNAMTDI